MNKNPQKRDAFDRWCELVTDLIIQPIIDFARHLGRRLNTYAHRLRRKRLRDHRRDG